MTNRNHHPDGQMQITQPISMHFHLPADGPNSWQQFLWLSQLNQAVGYKTETEHFRRIRTLCSKDTPGCNMGRMYWQTNDIWQGASWAAMDYTGRYKMVQYFTQHFYAPVLISSYCIHYSKCAVYIINDMPDDGVRAGNGRIKLTLYSWQ